MSTHPITEGELASAGLRYDVDGVVATITLDRPDVRNAQTPTMWRAMARIGQQLSDGVRVVVVRGRGQSFSAGLDRAMLDPASATDEETVAGLLGRTDEEIIDTIGAFQEGFTFLRDQRFVSIAVVQGHAIGAGFQLALSCDLRILAEDASLCMKESALGLVPDLTGTKPLVDAVGHGRALEICATARMVRAEEAASLGLAQAVVPVDRLDSTLGELVTALTAAPHGAVAETKALLQQAAANDLEQQRLAERTAQVRRFREAAGG